MIENPEAESLKFVAYTTAEGLTSDNARCLTEDAAGNIYVGTVRGVDRISPETKKIRHFSVADGLAADFVSTAFRDRAGNLWFGTPNGLSRLVPESEKELRAPQIFINELSIDGTRYRVSEFGQTEIGGIEVEADKNNLDIDFFSIGSADSIRYQYRLEGDAETDWSEPAPQRTVNFANLAPGNYRFLVRAVNNYDLESERPAVVSFRIRPPFYRTWTFFALLLLACGAGVFALERFRAAKRKEQIEAAEKLEQMRLERLAELEQVRRRIAADLHDDIGSSLTQIAVLSEVAKRKFRQKDGDSPLESITAISNELVEAMSDIVWAINPQKDNLRDLVQRMRRFVHDVFTARDVQFTFLAPDSEENLQIGANIRREAFVICKEAVNNAVKHSDCREASVVIKLENDFLLLEVADDGRGFDVERTLHESSLLERGGNGLRNIRRRAQALGGKCIIESEPGRGTRIKIKIPLHHTTTQMCGAADNNNGIN